MVAYSFKARFAGPIEARTKLHTLRNQRKRHAQVGEALQLYTGMRTKACRLVARETCTQLIGVTLDFSWAGAPVSVFEIAELIPGEPRRVGPLVPIDDVAAFALADGFASFGVMARWWWATHKVRRWSGILIGWGEPYPVSLSRVPRSAPLVEIPRRPAPWSAEPERWHAPAIAIELRRGGWSGDGLRTYRSAVDRRVVACSDIGAATLWRIDGRDGDHASLEDLAVVLLRLDRDAATDREWAA